MRDQPQSMYMNPLWRVIGQRMVNKEVTKVITLKRI